VVTAVIVNRRIHEKAAVPRPVSECPIGRSIHETVVKEIRFSGETASCRKNEGVPVIEIAIADLSPDASQIDVESPYRFLASGNTRAEEAGIHSVGERIRHLSRDPKVVNPGVIE